MISHGEGMHLWDQSGKKYIDASGGAFVNALGHGRKDIADKIATQLSRVAYINGTHFTSEPLELFSAKIAEIAPPGFDKVCLLNSGSEAVEAAVKYVRQLHVERGKEQKRKILSLDPSYHGNTLFALSTSARPHYKIFFGPLLTEVPMAPGPYEYRSPVSYESDGGKYYAEQLERKIIEEGPDSICAFIVEPMSASSCGASPPPPGYCERVSALCKKYDIYIIADEVACGAGRCGSYFASPKFGLEPDVIVLGKALNAGFIPVSALICKGSDIEAIARGSGAFLHAQTFMHSPSMAACVHAVLEEIDAQHLVENVAQQGDKLLHDLRHELNQHPFVGWITGAGLLIGIEFVEDKASKQPFPRKQKVIEHFTQFAFGQGLIVWPNKGQTPEGEGDLFMLAPPFNINDSDRSALVERCIRVVNGFFGTRNH